MDGFVACPECGSEDVTARHSVDIYVNEMEEDGDGTLFIGCDQYMEGWLDVSKCACQQCHHIFPAKHKGLENYDV